MVRAVHFGGANYLQNTYVGISQFPTPYSCGTISYWYKADQLATGTLLVGYSRTLDGHQVRILHPLRSGTNTITPSIGLQHIPTDSITPISNIRGELQTDVPYDGQWHNIIWAWNTNGGGSSPWIINAAVDGVPVSVGIRNLADSTVGFAIDYSWSNQWFVCTEYGAGIDYIGCLAEFFMYVSNDDYTAITGIPGVTARQTHSSFITNPDASGKVWPMYLGVDGSAVFHARPQIYLRGDRTAFPENHGGATSFTQVPPDSLTNCDSDPFPPVRASLFSGEDAFVENDGGLAGLPASSPYGFISYWYNGVPGIYDTVLEMYLPNDLHSQIIEVVNASDGEGRVSVNLLPDGTHQLQMVTTDSIPYDGKWHNVMIFWDTSSGNISCYFDGKPLSVQLYSQGGPFDITYPGNEWYIGGRFGAPVKTLALAELFVLIGTLANIDDPDIRGKFINSAGTAAEIASTGFDPFSDQGILPQIFLSGGRTLFPMNFPNYSFTLNSATDTAPSSAFELPYYIADAVLLDATSDPFGDGPLGPLDGVGGFPIALGDGPLGSAYIPKTMGPLNDPSGLPASLGSRAIPA